MEKVKGFISGLLAMLAGYGFYGIGLLGYAALSWVFLGGGLGNAIAWALVGAFVGKNAQAIKESLSRIKL